MSYCHTTLGRRNKLGDATAMMRWMRDNCVRNDRLDKLTAEQIEGKIKIGVHADRDYPEYWEMYKGVMAKAGYEGGELQ